MSGLHRVGDWIADRYEIYDIHLGGMGVVYVVYDHEGAAGHRVLAIKTLRDELLVDRRRLARFVVECQTWIKLDRHPNIVRAYSVQQIESNPHAILELVTGGSLRRWIGTPELDVPQALRFGIQICLGMEHAVQKGLKCHRDIKPENLLITDGGTLKITDFGVAKVIDEGIGEDRFDAIPLEGSGNDRTTPPTDVASSPTEVAPLFAETVAWEPPRPADSSGATPGSKYGETINLHAARPARTPGDPLQTRLTVDGSLLGTASYMAPEQFRDARAANIQADIYAIGVVLFEMLAGTCPFRGESLASLARQHARAKRPSIYPFIPKRYARVAKGIDRIIGRCLEKDRTRRYASLADMRLALSRCLWRAARERVSGPAESELDAWELTSKGVALGNLGRHDEERDCYEAAIRIKPDYVPAWFDQAAAAGTLGRPDEALDYAEVAIHLQPSSVPALINKGLALDALGRPDQAIACFDQAVHLQPRSPEVWHARGIILLNRGNRDGARAALDQALRLRPEFPEAIRAFGALASKSHLRAIGWVRRTEDLRNGAPIG